MYHGMQRMHVREAWVARPMRDVCSRLVRQIPCASRLYMSTNTVRADNGRLNLAHILVQLDLLVGLDSPSLR